MASRRDHTDIFSAIQQGRRRMRHPEKRRRNSAPFDQAPGSGARLLARAALQRAHRAGVRKLDPAFHSSQRQAASGADGAGGGRCLPDPATEGQVSAGTQDQALAALLFLYREVLRIELPSMENLVRVKRPRRIPAVLSREEACMPRHIRWL